MKITSFNILLFLSFFITANVKSQDTLFLQRKDKSNKEYNIPFNQFLVVVKLKNGEKINALVSGVIDSSIVFKVWDDKWPKRRKKRMKLHEIYANKKNDVEIKDSLAALLTYAYMDTIPSNEIKSIFLVTSERQDMRKFFNGLTAIGWTAVAMQLTAILAESPQLYSVAMIVLLVDGIVAGSVGYKTINMKKWEIKI
jgi:hypothetical protein